MWKYLKETSCVSSLYLKQSKMSYFSFYCFSSYFYKIREQEGRTGTAQRRGWYQWGFRKWPGKGVGG
jgi:hypothetical protein